MYENQLIIELSRLSNDLNVQKIQEILLENINWNYFYQISDKLNSQKFRLKITACQIKLM